MPSYEQIGMIMSCERNTFNAMLKFCDNEPLTAAEWEALSWLTLIDRNRLEFGSGNCRWAYTAAERADNLAFYQFLRQTRH